MKMSTILCSLLLCVNVGAYAEKESDEKQQREEAREKMESAREQLREAQRDYTEALKELRELQAPDTRMFGTRIRPQQWDWWGDFNDMQHFKHEFVFPHGDTGLYIFGNAHWQPHLSSQLQMTAINPELGRYFGTDKGVLVLNASEDNAYNLQPGDVILSINGREPRSSGRVLQLLRTYEPDETITLTIMRDKKKGKLTATAPGFTAFLESHFQ